MEAISMSDADQDALEWTLTTQQLLEQQFKHPEALRPPMARPPDDAALVRYLSGALASPEARLVEHGLIASAQARQRLRQTRVALARLQAKPWHDVTAAALSGDTVAQIWHALASEQAGMMTQSEPWWRAPEWGAIRRKAAYGVAEAQAALARLSALGEQFRTGLKMAGAVTVAAKGGEARPIRRVEGLPENCEIIANAHIDREGALQVSMRMRERSGSPVTVISSETAHLSLLYNGAVLPLASAIIAANRATWRVPEVGAVLGLSPGPLPTEDLYIVFGEKASSAPADTRVLLAGVLDSGGHPSPGRSIKVELREGPWWETGLLRIALSLDAVAQIAYSAYSLALDVSLFAERWQRLGVWPVRDWGEEPRRLVVSCPGAAETGRRFEAPLRVQLIPPGPE
jgi:hypothetical protein